MKRGRPSLSDQEGVFLEVIKYLEENDDEQVTINDLVQEMESLLLSSDHDAFSSKHMKRRIKEHFGDRIVITNNNGKNDVVTFLTTASSILQEHYQKPKSGNYEEEKIRIIKAAAYLIKNDIKICTSNSANEFFPSIESDLEVLEFLPNSLKVLLQSMFVGKSENFKVASIGQAIMQHVRPKAIIAPLQLGLAVQMHQHFASKFLIESLNRHGFCASYSTVKKYERSAALAQGTDIFGLKDGDFCQFSADNVDHNIRTLDGLNTFHGMGIIAIICPRTNQVRLIPNENESSQDLIKRNKIEINYFKQRESVSSLVYESLPDFQYDDATSILDQLWVSAWLLNPKRPLWNGFMQMIQKGSHPGKASVIFMPMIDMKSSNESCIYSTMIFISQQSKKFNTSPILTFDQPLWWKSVAIQNSEPPDSELKAIVLRLGGLHMQMSFMGAMGHLMSGSGIEDLLACIYAETAVTHMMSGKAISRAVRGHLIIIFFLFFFLYIQEIKVTTHIKVKEKY